MIDYSETDYSITWSINNKSIYIKGNHCCTIIVSWILAKLYNLKKSKNLNREKVKILLIHNILIKNPIKQSLY